MASGFDIAVGILVGLFLALLCHVIASCCQHLRTCNEPLTTLALITDRWTDHGENRSYHCNYKFYDYNPKHTKFFMSKLLDKYHLNIHHDIKAIIMEYIGDIFIFYIGPYQKTISSVNKIYVDYGHYNEKSRRREHYIL